MTPLAEDLFRQDHRVQAAMRQCAATGSGFSVSKRKTGVGRALVELVALVLGLSGMILGLSAAVHAVSPEPARFAALPQASLSDGGDR